MSKDGSPTTIGSSETMFSILEFVKERDGATVTECASALNLAKSTVHKHLATLKQQSLVAKRDGEYHIGLGFLEYGIYARNNKPVYELGRAKTEELAEETGELTWCKVEENGLEFPISMVRGSHAINVDMDIGTRSPMHRTSGGKAILAFLPDERIEEIVDEHGLDRVTENTITDRERLWEEIETIREERVAYNRGEDIPEVHSVASPIIDNNETVHGSLVVSAPKHRFTEREKEFIEAVRGASNELGINMTYHL